MCRVGRDERPHRRVAGVTRNHMSRRTSRTGHMHHPSLRRDLTDAITAALEAVDDGVTA